MSGAPPRNATADDAAASCKPLRGRVALVTGASGGLGAHFARTLAAAGARVAVTSRRLDACGAVCAGIADTGGEAIPVMLDVTDAASIVQAVAATVARLGGLDILVNNAGITQTRPTLEVADAEWERVIATDLTGAFRTAQSAARHMRDAGTGGAIVNIASILALRVAAQVAAYATAKAGLVHMTRALALEWARHRIRVNALCPGYIETDLNRDFFASEAGQAMIRRIPQRRLGRPEDLDGALLLLCGPAGDFITGTEIVVDGGHMMSSL